MKRSLVFIAALLSAIMCYAQQEWESLSYWSLSDLSGEECIYHKNKNSAILYNEIARTQTDKKKNILSPQTAQLPINLNRDSKDKRISLYIEDINNDPQRSTYPVYNKDKSKWEDTNDIYWSITINMQGADDKDYYISYIFHNCGEHKAFVGWPFPLSYKAAPARKYCIYGNLPTSDKFNTSMQAKGTPITSGDFPDHGGFKKPNKQWTDLSALPCFIGITLEEDNLCTICFDDSTNIGTNYIKQIRGINNIEFNVFAGSKIRIYNLKIEQQSLYSTVVNFIKDGNNKYEQEEYYAAAMEYTKAIDKGYKNYDIYYRRACAFYFCNDYGKAIQDFTDAISYKSTADAFFGLGISKLQIDDTSGLEDLQKGGEKGEALLHELEKMFANEESSRDKVSSDNRRKKTSVLIKDKNFSIK